MSADASLPTRGNSTHGRKSDHLRINLQEDVASRLTAGFDAYRFVPRALPEIDLDAVDLSTAIFGRQLGAPLLISCMTGGTAEAEAVNRVLAGAADRFSIALGLGSGRVLLERPEALPSFAMRPLAPNALLFANLGAVQLNRGVTVDDCRRLVDMLDADCLVLHLNALQEALQPEGDTCFAGLLPRIEALCSSLEVPVMVKEVGWGISVDVAAELVAAGVAAVDVAGAGGTSWSEVERHRLDDSVLAQAAVEFAGWGIPTAEALVSVREALPDALVVASGGVRGGLDVAKCLALGANLVGAAGPFLRAASAGEDELHAQIAAWIATLRIALFCLGAADLAALHAQPRLIQVGGNFPTGLSSDLAKRQP